MKRIAVVVILLIVFTIQTVWAVVPPDITGHWGRSNIEYLIQRKAISGYPDGTFKPDYTITRAEFTKILLISIGINPGNATEGHWASHYIGEARERGYLLPNEFDDVDIPITRGEMARMIVRVMEEEFSDDLDEYASALLDFEQIPEQMKENVLKAYVKGIVTGYPDGTFGVHKTATRAEASTMIVRLIDNSKRVIPQKPAAGSKELVLWQVGIGDTEQKVIQTLGQPARKDWSKYGFHWYIYNQDYSRYIQVGVLNEKVVGLYSNTGSWKSEKGIGIGTSRSIVHEKYGEPLTGIRKGHTIYQLDNEHADTYLVDDCYITLFYDSHSENTVTAVQLIDKEVEEKLQGFYGPSSDELRDSFERQIFDLANAVRVRMGMPAFQWDEKIAVTARKHSEDMAKRNFFSHDNPDGQSPFDRMEADGITFRMAAENIAMGQTSAIFVHEGWMNSLGHRKNILGDCQRLGVGVYLGGTYHTYYTQNFYTPR